MEGHPCRDRPLLALAPPSSLDVEVGKEGDGRLASAACRGSGTTSGEWGRSGCRPGRSRDRCGFGGGASSSLFLFEPLFLICNGRELRLWTVPVRELVFSMVL